MLFSTKAAMVLLFSSHVSTFLPFPADICVPISESVLSPHISPLDEHNKHSTKEHNWRKSGKMHAKHPLKSKTCSYVINKKKQKKNITGSSLWWLSSRVVHFTNYADNSVLIGA